MRVELMATRMLLLSQKALLIGTVTQGTDSPILLGVVLVPWCPSELGQMPGRDPVFQALGAVAPWLVVGGWSELPGREEGGN